MGTEDQENQMSRGMLTAKNAKAVSVSRFSNFNEMERASSKF
jgi:hypothetical protein